MSWKCCQLPIFVGMYSNPSAQVSIVDPKTKSTTRRWVRNGYRPFSLIWYKILIRFFFRTCFGFVRARGTRDKIPQMCQKIAECWECAVYVPDLCSNRLETWLSLGFGTTRSQQYYDFEVSFSKRWLQLCRVLRRNCFTTNFFWISFVGVVMENLLRMIRTCDEVKNLFDISDSYKSTRESWNQLVLDITCVVNMYIYIHTYIYTSICMCMYTYINCQVGESVVISRNQIQWTPCPYYFGLCTRKYFWHFEWILSESKKDTTLLSWWIKFEHSFFGKHAEIPWLSFRSGSSLFGIPV